MKPLKEDSIRNPGEEGEASRGSERRPLVGGEEGFDPTLAEVIGPGEVAYVIDAELVDRPGSLLEYLAPIVRMEANILKLHANRTGKRRGRVLAIIAFTPEKAPDSPDDIKRTIESLASSVLKLEVYGPYYGPTIVAPPPAGYLASPPGSGAGRILLMRTDTIQYLFDTLYWAMPQTMRPLGLQVLYMLGRFIGAYMASLASKIVGDEGGRRLVEEALSILVAGGWAREYQVEATQGGPGEATCTVTLRGYWLRPLEIQPGSHTDPLTAGMLEEILEEAWEGTWNATLEEWRPGGPGSSRFSLHRYRAVRVE